MLKNLLNLLGSAAKGEKSMQLTKDEAAELLKARPELLDQFESAYARSMIDDSTDPGMNSKAASAMVRRKTGESEVDEEFLDDVCKRILDELWSINGTALPDHKMEGAVTNAELREIPITMRPQLTGSMWQKDLGGPPTYYHLLSTYKNYLDSDNPKDKQQYYHMFRQGLDILDLDPVVYKSLGMNKNSMGYWLPALKAAADRQKFFRIPETKIVKVPLPILQLSRLEYMELTPITLKIVDDWAFKAFQLDEDKTYFVKTGCYSQKFDFRNCKVTGKKEVHELGEYLLYIQHYAVMMAGPNPAPDGKAYSTYGVSTTNEWVVREYIEDVENNPTIYHGMPLHTEYRAFVDFDSREVLGIVPYWDPETMKNRFSKEADADEPDMIHDYVIYKAHEETLMNRYHENVDKVVEALKVMIPDVDLSGQWSLDIMQNGEDFWLIDMALAQNSAYKECCIDRLRPITENWLPDLSREN